MQADYSSDLSDTFDIQLVSFSTSLNFEIATLSSVQQPTHLQIVDYCAMASPFPDVVTALLLFLTLSVTVASDEQSFSKLRLIKNYLHSTEGQERLSSLALLSTEAQQAEATDTQKLIDNFAHAKMRRKEFR